MTLRELADKLGVHPYDLVGDAELADELMDEDIAGTIFYQELANMPEFKEVMASA